MSAEIKAGAVFVVSPYPFVRDSYAALEIDADGEFIYSDLPSWKPGVRYEDAGRYGEDVEAFADALGEQILTVVDVHKPGRFPTRVFYTRQWKNPDGKVFGKNKLHITTLDAFRRRTLGFLVEFKLKPDEQGDA